MDFQEFLEEFYGRYNVELIRAPEGFSTCARARQR
jgi:chromosome partition protein MukE